MTRPDVRARAAATSAAVATARTHRRDALIVGVVAAVLAVALSWVPSVWYDEAATVTAARRSTRALFDLFDVVDVVHGVYYGTMHVWFELVGYTPFTLRLPSALAAGVAAALTVLLVQRFGTRRLALIAGLVLAVLPRFTWAGAEGRSFAIGTALAVGSTLALVAALDAEGAGSGSGSRAGSRRRRIVRWAGYGALSALAIAVFLYLAFVVLAHALLVLAVARGAGRHRMRAVLLGYGTAALGAVAAVAPLVLDAQSQAAQVGWIQPIGPGTWHGIVVTQFFPHAPVVAAVAWPLALGGVLVLLWRCRPGRAAAAAAAAAAERPRQLAALALAWLIVPTVGVIAASLLVTPLYSPRYLTFAIPAFAICVAVLLDAIPWRPVAVVAAAALLVVTAPVYLEQRTVEAKQGSTWSQAAALVARESARIDGPQAVLYGLVRRHPTANARIIATTYPDAFAGLDDVTSAGDPYGLWERSVALRPEQVRGDSAVWMLTTNLADDLGKRRVLAEAGFVETREWKLDWVHVVLFEPRG